MQHRGKARSALKSAHGTWWEIFQWRAVALEVSLAEEWVGEEGVGVSNKTIFAVFFFEISKRKIGQEDREDILRIEMV